MQQYKQAPEYGLIANVFMRQNTKTGISILEEVVKLQIRRIQNATRYQIYELLRMDVARRLIKRPATLLDRYPMWHGTTEERVKQITKDRFDRGKAGTNG